MHKDEVLRYFQAAWEYAKECSYDEKLNGHERMAASDVATGCAIVCNVLQHHNNVAYGLERTYWEISAMRNRYLESQPIADTMTCCYDAQLLMLANALDILDGEVYPLTETHLIAAE